MFQLGVKIEAFAQKAPAAVLIRSVLQRDLHSQCMNTLFWQEFGLPNYSNASVSPLSIAPWNHFFCLCITAYCRFTERLFENYRA